MLISCRFPSASVRLFQLFSGASSAGDLGFPALRTISRRPHHTVVSFARGFAAPSAFRSSCPATDNADRCRAVLSPAAPATMNTDERSNSRRLHGQFWTRLHDRVAGAAVDTLKTMDAASCTALFASVKVVLVGLFRGEEGVKTNESPR
jgi:hypothetical protein